MKSPSKITHIILALLFSIILMNRLCAETSDTVDPYAESQSEFTENFELWYTQAKSLVSISRGIEFTNLSVRVGSTEETRASYSNWNQATLSNHTQFQYSENPLLFEKEVDQMVQSSMGMYLYGSKVILINEEYLIQYSVELQASHSVSLKELTMSLLLHELVHAADDYEFDMARIFNQHTGAFLNLQMTLEGHAQEQTETYCKALSCSNAFTAQLSNLSVQSDASVDVDQDYPEQNFFLTYGRGYSFIKSLRSRDPSLVKYALQNPPSSVLEFFKPASFPDLARKTAQLQTYEILESFVSSSIENVATTVPGSFHNDRTLPLDLQERLSYVESRLSYERASAVLHLYLVNDPASLALTISLQEFRSDDTALVYGKKTFRQYTNIYNDEAEKTSNFEVITTEPFSKQETPHNSWSFSSNNLNFEENPVTSHTSIIVQGAFALEIVSYSQPELHSEILTTSADYLSDYLTKRVATHPQPPRDVRTYRSSYKGLTTGLSTFTQTVQALGQQSGRRSFNRYVFPNGIEVTFKNKVIKTIIVNNNSYIDINGISVGADRKVIDSLEGVETRQHKRVTTDLTHGIAYWYDDNDKLRRIVLIAELKRS